MWDAFTRVGEYRAWWPWLAGFDGTAFAEGEQWRCEVSPPLPYSLNFSITLVEVVPNEFVRAQVDGDIGGWAELSAVDTSATQTVSDSAAEGGVVPGDRPAMSGADQPACELRLRSALSPLNPVLRLVTLGARPVASYGHDWVLDSGVRQFRRRLDEEG